MSIRLIVSNIVAGVVQAVIIFGAILAVKAVSGTGVASFFDAEPSMMLLGFAFLSLLMAFAFGSAQLLWTEFAKDMLGLTGMASDAIGCAVTMIVYCGIWIAGGGYEQEFAFATAALVTVSALVAGCVRYWVASSLPGDARSA